METKSRVEVTKLESQAKIEVAKLQVAKEAIVATQSFFEVLKSHKVLQATRVEWEGKVQTAKTSVRKAEVDLETARENNKPKMEELEQSRAVLSRLLLLFDEVMREVSDADLSNEVRKESRQYLLKLSDHIVQLKN